MITEEKNIASEAEQQLPKQGAGNLHNTPTDEAGEEKTSQKQGNIGSLLLQIADNDQEELTEEAVSGKGRSSVKAMMRILGGDMLTSDFFRRQVKLLVLLVIMAIIYISNRYSCQQEMIEIDQLKKKLTDIKYDALTRSSELTEKSRQSHIEEYISKEGSALQTSTNPPYLIK